MDALDKSARRKIFYTMAVIFAAIVPLALLYSRGYVFDFQSRGLVATGGVFVKTVQSGTRIFVDSEFQRETSFISRGALLTNLLPRRYAVRVEKEGFRSWEKTARVSNEEVLEFRNVFLPPATVTPSLVFSAGRSQVPSRLTPIPGRPEFGLELGGAARPFTLFILNVETRLSRVNFARVSSWSWDGRGQTFIIGRNEEGIARWYQLAMAGGAPASGEEPVRFRGLPPGFSADTLTPHPANAGEFYFSAGGALFLQGRSNVPLPIAEQVHSYAVSGDRLYFVSKNGFFVASNLDGGEIKVLGRKGLFLESGVPAEFHIAPNGDVLLIDSAGGLFHYQPGKDVELEFVGGNVLGLDFSQSGDRAVFWDGQRVWVYWLRDNPGQPFNLARTKKQIFFSDEPIKAAFLNAEGTYLFLAAAKSIRMSEIDDRGGTNVYNLVAADVDSFFLDKENLILYWTDGAKVYRAPVK